jgi:exoribonuclease R
MPLPKVACDVADELFAEGLRRIREDLQIPDRFPPEVEAAAASTVPDPPAGAGERDDRRDLGLVTLDPPASMDLDQAFAIERRSGGGWRVWYAIADVAAFVPAGGPVDTEARERGVTLYLPDERSALHPPVLSEGSASLLPDEDRPALLWRLEVDGDGTITSGRVRRALVRSRAKLDYPSAQAAADAGNLADDDPIALLRACGHDLLAAEEARGGVSLPLPEQHVQRDDGEYQLGWRSPLPVESWNAQLSLLCGRAAANLMLQGGVGLLRTLPPFEDRAVKEVRRRGKALGLSWPDGPPEVAYPAFVRSIDPDTPAGAAILNTAARVLRGATYAAFGPGVGPAPTGEAAEHNAVAAPYAHVTAPLRRLADRFAAEAALSVATQVDVPEWVLAGLAELPRTMDAANQRESQVSREVVDLAEAVVLGSRLGRELDAVVVSDDGDRGSSLQVLDPPVRARAEADLELGATVRVRVDWADPVARRVGLVPVAPAGG